MALPNRQPLSQPVLLKGHEKTSAPPLAWTDLPEVNSSPGRWVGRALRLSALLLAASLPVLMSLPNPTGELTQAAGIPDNRFAPTTPPPLFSPPLAQVAAEGEYYDVLVFGGRFSTSSDDGIGVPAGGMWTDHLRNLTGLSVAVAPVRGGIIGSDPISALVRAVDERDPQLMNAGIVILQLPERKIQNLPMIPAGNPSPGAEPARAVIAHLLPAGGANSTVGDTSTVGGSNSAVGSTPLSPVTVQDKPARVTETAGRQLITRPLGLRPMAQLDGEAAGGGLLARIDTGITVIRRAVTLAILGSTAGDDLAGGSVQEQKLRNTGLFSSPVSASTLFLTEDFAPWRNDQSLLIERRRELMRLQAMVESVGGPRFLLMIAPDKGSVYGPLLQQPVNRPSQVEATLAGDPQLHLVPLVSSLRAMASGGMVDLYASNSSLWAAPGHTQAARSVAATLDRLGFTRSVSRPQIDPAYGIRSDCLQPCPAGSTARTAFGSTSGP